MGGRLGQEVSGDICWVQNGTEVKTWFQSSDLKKFLTIIYVDTIHQFTASKHAKDLHRNNASE
jgi:hypothetical protein